jgi:hypothetical protein
MGSGDLIGVIVGMPIDLTPGLFSCPMWVEALLSWIFGCLCWAVLIKWALSKNPKLFDDMAYDLDHPELADQAVEALIAGIFNRDERTVMGMTSRDPKAQGGGGVRRPQDLPKLILRSHNNRTKIQDYDYTASHGR